MLDTLDGKTTEYDNIDEKTFIEITTSYPRDSEYDYKTRLERINLDQEKDEDIMNNKGFIISPTHGIKKDLLDNRSIFSRKFGQTMKDIEPFGNRYRCECGHLTKKVNLGFECNICHTKVKFVDDDYAYFGWIVLQRHWVISPAFYNSLKQFFGRSFDDMIRYEKAVDMDGNPTDKTNSTNPYYGIGMIEFREKFDEIMKYYLEKNKKQDKYDDIMSCRDRVFTQSIPVFTTLLRPYDSDKYTLPYEKTNEKYEIINKFASTLNNDIMLDRSLRRIVNTNGGIKREIEKNSEKQVCQLLYKMQLKIDELYNEIIDIIKGKRGCIRTLFGGRCNFTTRNVIVADPGLRIDEVRLPYAGLVELLQQSIINILVKTHSLSYSDAYRRWYESTIRKDKTIMAIINNILANALPNHRGLPVLINRNPTINYGSIFAMYVIGCSDEHSERMEYVMQLPLQILKSLNADFDGDVLNCVYIVNRSFWEIANNVFNPRNAFYLSRNDGLFNNDVNHQKDTLINATMLSELGQSIYTDDDLNNVKRIQQKWQH